MMSKVAAASFCLMRPQDQRFARRASALLEKNRYATAHGANPARQYTLHAAQGDACVPFKKPSTAIATR